MNETIWNRRIPTLFGIVLIGVGLVVTTYVAKTQQVFQTNAAIGDIPKNVRVTNITDTSLTISYTTTDSIPGSLSFGKDTTLGKTIFDNRSNNPNPRYTIHYFTVTDLTPDTMYYFSILSGGITYVDNNAPFTVKTASKISEKQNESTTIKGKIILANGNAPKDALVLVKTNDSQTLSTLTGTDGSYIIPLTNFRAKDLTKTAILTSQTILDLLITNGTEESSIKIHPKETTHVPLIVLGKQYDFRLQDAALIDTNEQEATLSAQKTFTTITASASASIEPEILSPKKDASLSDQRPIFRGKAEPNESVKIIIHSEEQIETSVTTDLNGNWSFRPQASLSPGQHVISIITRDRFGVLKTVTQSFTVFAEGSQVSQSATPSATIVPSPTKIPTITPTKTQPSPTATLTPTPSTPVVSALSPTQIALVPTTVIITPTPVVTKGGQPPASGSTLFTLIGFLSGIGITIGTLLFVSARKPL